MKQTTFAEAYRVAKPRTLLSETRCRALWLLGGLTEGIPGDVLELGSYKGGSLFLLAAACPTRQVYGIDTYAGMPDMASAGIDGRKAGEFGDTSFISVRHFVASLPNARPISMKFPEGMANLRHLDQGDPFLGLGGPFSMAHFDGDLYSSCVAFLDFVLPRLSPGGAIVFDDYRWEKCPGVQKAIEERGLEVVWAMANQAVYVKR